MAVDDAARVTILGLGDMGRALARTLAEAGHTVTVANRTPGRAEELKTLGITEAASFAEAIDASPLVVACLLDHGSVHDALGPHVAALSQRTLVNLTSTAPSQARELADWAKTHGIAYLDGGIMAAPQMIGTEVASIFYSGSAAVHERHRALFELWGEAPYFGEDAGMASLWDFALLSNMYILFSGFFHGAAMVGASGVTPTQFAKRAVPFLTAFVPAIDQFAATIESGDYTTDVQHLNFTKAAADSIHRTAVEQGVNPAMFEHIKNLIDRHVAAGHGAEAFDRIYESFKNPAT